MVSRDDRRAVALATRSLPTSNKVFITVPIRCRIVTGSEFGSPPFAAERPIVHRSGMLIMVAAFASILGMQMSLRCRTTVKAVMASVGIVIGACGALGWCGFSALQSRTAEMSVVVSSFSPFTLLTMLINPYTQGGRMFDAEDTSGTARLLIFIFSWAATGLYALLVWTMYKSMVKNFDMTSRKQSR